MWADGVGDRSLEHHTLGLKASEVHTHDLARLEHAQKPSYAIEDQTQARDADRRRPAEVDSGVE
jgi:hypothetical protein